MDENNGITGALRFPHICQMPGWEMSFIRIPIKIMCLIINDVVKLGWHFKMEF
jgi:hypothetical protein